VFESSRRRIWLNGFQRRTGSSRYIQPERDYTPEDLIKITIPGAARPTLRRTLYYYGITRGTLFPGLDGLASEIESAFRHGFVLRPEELLQERDG